MKGAKYYLKLKALISSARNRKSVQIPGPQYNSDVKSRVVAIMGSPEQTGAVNVDTSSSKAVEAPWAG
jgi:hypothetical protein